MLECQFYEVCQRVIHEKLLSMRNISEMHLPIIFEDLARFLGNGKWFKNSKKYNFLCSNTFTFYYILGVEHKKNKQNNKIESFFSIQMSQINYYNFVGNSNLKVETAGKQMKALNFVT